MRGFEQVMAALRAGLAPRGFDLMQPFCVGSYNELVEPALALADFGSGAHLAVVVGNTRALWPVWLDALAADAALAARSDPLDWYTEQVLHDVMGRLGVAASVRFAHETGPPTLPIQRVAHAAGLAFLTETHTSVHPTYGPWIGLRAVLSLDVAGPPEPPAPLAHPCGGCAGGCRPAFERALATLAGAPTEANARAHWRAWLACRDACPTGREHRYSQAQIDYHYRRQPLERPLGRKPQL
jgi:methylmalonic aciduria homocystinuria type C protein